MLKRNVYIAGDNIISSLGFDTEENMENILAGNSGLIPIKNKHYKTHVSPIDWNTLDNKFSVIKHKDRYTPLEQLFILSIMKAIDGTGFDPGNNKTVIIISTTKGNIDLIKKDTIPEQVQLWTIAEKIEIFFKASRTPLITCNACISGINAIITGAQLVQQGLYDNAIITGGDLLSDFILSGFNALKAISSEKCRPYDADRDGLNLGEACGTLILTSDQKALNDPAVSYWGGATTNDANHISGPSRDGKGLFLAIKKTLQEHNVKAEQPDAISAHGTATVYNDEMESKAFVQANMGNIPLYSLKGFWGHTLGAAGIIESIAAIHSLKRNTVLPTAGFKKYGVSGSLTISEKPFKKNLRMCLKTASGFGGGNAGILFKKWINQ